MKLHACGTYVMAKLPPKEQLSKGGIVIPNGHRGLILCQCISVGDGKNSHDDMDPPCKPGDLIMINGFDPNQVLRDGEDQYAIVDFRNVVAIGEQ